jgi:hypothetical protein
MLARGRRGRESGKPFQKLVEGRHLVEGSLPARNHLNPILNLWKPQIYYSMVPVGKVTDGKPKLPTISQVRYHLRWAAFTESAEPTQHNP